MQLEFSQQIFEKPSNTKFHENPFSGSRVVPCGLAGGRTDRRAGMTKPIAAFRNFSNALKKIKIISTENMDKCDSSRCCCKIQCTYEPWRAKI